MSNRSNKQKAVESKVTTYKPLPWQVEPIRQHVAALREGIKQGPKPNALKRGIRQRHEGSDMGVGKTFILLFTAKELGMPIIVIAPKTSQTMWIETSRAMGVPCEFFSYEKLVSGKHNLGEFPELDSARRTYQAAKDKHDTATALALAAATTTEERNDVIRVSAATAPSRAAAMQDVSKHFQFYTTRVNGKIIIFDESHRTNGIESTVSELLIAARRQDLIAITASATPSVDPTTMKALGYFLGLHSLHDFDTFMKLNGCMQNNWGQQVFCGDRRTMLALRDEIYPDSGCRVPIAKIKHIFPATQITAEALQMDNSDAIRKVYEDMERELDLIASKGSSKSPRVIVLRARQKAEILKVPNYVADAKSALAQGSHVLLFVNFTATLEALAEKLKTDSLYYGGNKKERNNHLKRFQANEVPILILNIAAGAESISCHDLSPEGDCPRYSIISPTWSPTKLHQVTGRSHRAGGTSPSIQRIIYAAGSIEEKVCAKVRKRLGDLSTLNDGRMLPDHLLTLLGKIGTSVKDITEDDRGE